MLKRKLCETRFEWNLSCKGPLLIADGRYDYDNVKDEKKSRENKGEYPHKVFISHAPDGPTIEKIVKATGKAGGLNLPFYIPGTSLRGPFRAQAERIIRSLLPEGTVPPVTACDPFQIHEETRLSLSCSKRLETDHHPSAYAAACPACKLFGCTGTASRIQFTDADLPTGSYQSVYRDMIGIDRFTGGVFQGEKDEKGGKKSGGANMRFHALENTAFTTTVTVTNFELWQLGLLAYVFRDFQEGLVPIGFGKTKGFGVVKGEVKKVSLVYPAGSTRGNIQHLGSLMQGEEYRQYGLQEYSPPTCDLSGPEPGVFSLYETFVVTNIDAFWAVIAPAFNDFIAAKTQKVAP